MYDLPSEDPEESGLPDEFHDLQPQLLSRSLVFDGYRASPLGKRSGRGTIGTGGPESCGNRHGHHSSGHAARTIRGADAGPL